MTQGTGTGKSYSVTEINRDLHVERAMKEFNVTAEQVTSEMRRYAKLLNYTDWYSAPFGRINK